ncbi:MAG TPA: hypothetical protein VK548_22065 [Candidatus Acidoferrum sp.]|nr:hypothetical protein [Candidatus Acidoferrum sp.]
MATTAGTQAVQFVVAVARGVAKGIAGAARELGAPARDAVESPSKTTRASGDSAARGIKRAARGRRGAATRSRRGTGTTKRRSA